MPRPPNILFILTDQLNARALGATGHARAATPNIDRTARRDVRFTRVHCVNLWQGWITQTGDRYGLPPNDTVPQSHHPMKSAPDWQCLNPQAPWQGRDSQGYTIWRGEMWILGGWFTPQTPNPRDVWHSANGRDWTCATAEAPWPHSDLPVTLAFRDRLWLMGGRRLPGKENSNAVWSSADGANWIQESPAAGWCPRVSAAHVVFQDRMWVLGGTENFYEDNEHTLHNDVWCSANGRDWTCVTAHAPWSPRAHHQAVVFANKIWIIGGGGRFPVTHTCNDVWCSADGLNWTQVTAAAEWVPRLWHSAVAWRDHLWVLGGISQAIENLGDVWCSRDGQNWTQLQSNVIWTPRHAQAVFALPDRLVLAAGHANPVNSEVWSLELPADFFADHPAG
ncbi:MAG: sulfatase-like hydrolase/transferase [Opitutaceae bacterium]|nr:sulfatase-like hydrolase/transferase [Opitutaceae bacterium]